MNRTIIAVLAVVALVAAGWAAFSLGVIVRGEPALGGTELENAPPVGDITLVSGTDQQVRLSDYSGRYLVVFFGYTNCPDICPITMARLGSLYRSLGEPEGVQVAMITVDPERDPPAVVDGYAKNFHPEFVGLGGTAAALEEAANRFYIGHPGDGQGGILHSDPVILVDRESRYWRVYNSESQQYLEDDLRALLGRS